MNNDLTEVLELSNKGQVPSPYGKEQYIVYGPPASVQSSKAIRDKYLNSIKEQFQDLKYILTGEIVLDIVWYVSAKNRYETDAKNDIDNCIKPIIDAFTGPEGLFIDDCQLRGLYICWRHTDKDEEKLVFDLNFQGDQFSPKENLAFVQLDGALCVPVNMDWPEDFKAIFVEFLKKSKNTKDQLEQLRAPYLQVSGILAGNQPFHRTRVKGFPVYPLDDFIK